MTLSPGMDAKQFVSEAAQFEEAGVRQFAVSEAYGADAVSVLGALSFATTRATLSTAIVPLYSRTPSLLAMTAVTLDALSDGRFDLGIGSSGPQVIEGFHGVGYETPLGRTREVVEICRMLWRRQAPLEYSGRYYSVPFAGHSRTGLGKPLKLIGRPVREAIPVTLAAIGPKSVALAAEIAEGWMPSTFWPEKCRAVWGGALDAGSALRDPALSPLAIAVRVPYALGSDVSEEIDRARDDLALYIGGMGARGKNFYSDLVGRYGLAEEAAAIQDAYLAGDKSKAARLVPHELVEHTSLLGDTVAIADRVEAYRKAGVSILGVSPKARRLDDRLAQVASLCEIVNRDAL